jgi:hypothetical protein
MVAYSFQKRFVGHVLAGLEPGPWCPGMKRHTLRKPRLGRQGHARPEQPAHLYTAMRTKHCRKLGQAPVRVQIPLRIATCTAAWPLILIRRAGAAPRSKVANLAPIVQQILDMPVGAFLAGESMDDFARTDGFADTAEMRAFFEAPEDLATLDLVLIGWSPDA